MRASGILLPISSIPSSYGIGTFSKEAYEFVDFLKEAGQTYWQILPLGPTGYGDSPYQSFSTFAGNPYYIDLEQLIEKGWLKKESCDKADTGDQEAYVDDEKIYRTRFQLLREAFENSQIEKDPEFAEFAEKNKDWLLDYALYMAVKDEHKGKSWAEWEDAIRLRQKKAMDQYTKRLKDEILFYEFQQYLFAQQWKQLKAYAKEKGIQIIGDIPIYVAFDSADTWAGPELFPQRGSCGEIRCTAGIITDRQAMNGGCAGFPTALSFMMWSGSIISADLMNIIVFLMETGRRSSESGSRGRATSFLRS